MKFIAKRFRPLLRLFLFGLIINQLITPKLSAQDWEPAQLIYSYPVHLQTDIDLLDTFIFVFDKPLKFFWINISPGVPADGFQTSWSANRDSFVCITRDYFLKNQMYHMTVGGSTLVYPDSVKYNPVNYRIWFTTKDTVIADVIPPHILRLDPWFGATEIAADKKLSIKFTGGIQKGQGNIYISENGTLKQTIPVSSGNVTVKEDSVKINPLYNFTPGASVSIRIDSGAFKDLSGNDFKGILNSSYWNFTINNDFSAIQETYENDDVNIYPNPFNTSATLNINPELIIKYAELKIFGVLGNLVKTIPIHFAQSIQIEREDLPNGLYFYQLIQAEGNNIISTGKIVVE